MTKREEYESRTEKLMLPIVEEMINTYNEMTNGSTMLSEQIDTPYPNPTFVMNRDVKNFYDFKVEDFALENYQYCDFNHKIEVAI